MTYDVAAVRAQVPALRSGWAFFDGPGGTQTPQPVIDAIADALGGPLSNRGSVTLGEQRSEDVVAGARAAMADLLGADPRGIVFGRSATQLAYDVSRAQAKQWRPGDEVVVTRLDHDSNIRPWVQAAGSVGATVRWVDFDPRTSELETDRVADAITDRTRLVAVTAASNLLGTRPDLPALAALTHDRGALLYVDGVHHTAHSPVDVAALGADFYSCSAYKFLGPHIGVLTARPELLETLHPDKLLPSTDRVPERFELGTLPYEMLAGVTAAVDFLASLAPDVTADRRSRVVAGMRAVEEHEEPLRIALEAALADLPGVTVHSRARSRTPTLLVSFSGRPSEAAYRHLAEQRIAAPAGSFYALEASRHLGLGDSGALRIGLAPYTDRDDVDRLLEGLADFVG